jgi:hypothetical protein
MEIKFAPRSAFRDRGPCIQMIGDWVTEDVWNVVSRLMNDCYIHSPSYIARQGICAFFQGGYHDSRGKWILLEFWADEEKCAPFVKLLNEEINKVINDGFTQIALVAHSNNEHHINDFNIAVEVLKDFGCPVATAEEAAQHKCRALFLPENNLQYEKVFLEVEHRMNSYVRRLAWMDAWELKELKTKRA